MLVCNPMNPKQLSRVDITPDVVDAIVFWTKAARAAAASYPREKYRQDSNAKAYAYYVKRSPLGLVIFSLDSAIATTLDITVKKEKCKKGIGTKLLDSLFAQFGAHTVIASTDDDAVGFYRKYGFTVAAEKALAI